MSYTQMASLSMNQVLLRSLNTTISSLLPVLSLLVVGAFIMGAVTLEEFAVALTIGLLVGAYSSIFVAAPVLVFLKERQPQIRTIRERLEAQGVSTTKTPERLAEARGNAATVAPVDGSSTAAPKSPTAPTASGAIPPRPRKKTRKR
jgi:preprotein translocase subunit SecF